MHFSRHARNRARQLGITVADAESVIEQPVEVDLTQAGKTRYVGYVRDQRVRVVVPLDDPALIVTIHRRRR